MKTMILALALLLAIPAHADPRQYRSTYTASSAAFSPPATPTDLATITGSATKTIYVTKVKLSCTQTTAGINAFFLVKRSGADLTGTSDDLTEVPHDSRSPAASATVLDYTANPGTLGTTVGSVHAAHVLCPAPASVSSSSGRIFDFGEPTSISFAQPIVLRGITQVLAINFAGAALPTGLSVIAGFEWYEE